MPKETDNLDDLLEQVRDLVMVTCPSGSTIKVLSDSEKDHYEQIAARYLSDNIFQNVTDYQELDRLLIMELMVYRWSQWLSEERDYAGELVNVDEIRKNIIENSKEIRLVKKALGLDKATRDRESSESVSDFIHSLKLRAKEFGIMRNDQAISAITMWKELIGIITFYHGSTDEERREFNRTADDIMQWIFDQNEKFEEIDSAMRENQKMWVREL
jgi:hypothetical protein